MKAVITGATKGIGRAIAEKLIEEGVDIAICARTTKDLLVFERYLNQQYPQREVLIFGADLAQKKQVLAFAQFIKGHWQQLDILVNNLGLFVEGSIQNEPDGLLEQLMQTNVFSAYYLTRHLLELMLPFQKGHIFNMCSIASLAPYAYGSAYTITKFALLGFSKSLREEMKPHGISVTSILPGPTWSSAWKGVDHFPQDRLMHPKDIAQLLWSAWQVSPSAVIEEILIRPQLGDIE